ncbi:hypothetical protein U1Q18_032109 [Sarracenia purpurea var. burkii]
MPEVKRLREDLLANLEDLDLGTTCSDLDSFMESFEEEISASSHPAALVDLTSEFDKSHSVFLRQPPRRQGRDGSTKRFSWCECEGSTIRSRPMDRSTSGSPTTRIITTTAITTTSM